MPADRPSVRFGLGGRGGATGGDASAKETYSATVEGCGRFACWVAVEVAWLVFLRLVAKEGLWWLWAVWFIGRWACGCCWVGLKAQHQKKDQREGLWPLCCGARASPSIIHCAGRWVACGYREVWLKVDQKRGQKVRPILSLLRNLRIGWKG
jgi:hypothetical protein